MLDMSDLVILLTASWPGSSPQVGFTRLAALYSAELGQARVPMPSTSYFRRQDVDAWHKAGHDKVKMVS